VIPDEHLILLQLKDAPIGRLGRPEEIANAVRCLTLSGSRIFMIGNNSKEGVIDDRPDRTIFVRLMMMYAGISRPSKTFGSGMRCEGIKPEYVQNHLISHPKNRKI